MREIEVAIVGGGPAGLTAALFLAHAKPELADRIAVLERERYPRDKFCAGAMGRRADKILAEIGVSLDVPSVPIHGMSAAFKRGTIVLREPEIGRVVRRIEMDHALANAARARGVSVIEGMGVASVAWDSHGAVLSTPQGPLKTRVLVGADGVGSVVRRAMGLPFGRIRAQVAEVDTEPVASDDPARELLRFDFTHRDFPGYLWDFPTVSGGRRLVCRGAYVLSPRADRSEAADVKQILRAHLRTLGLDLDRYRLKRFSERGFEPSLELSRPGALLAGEAAGIDPVLGEGIPQAIEYGALAGRYLAEKLTQNDLDFRSYTGLVRASRLGRDLRLRAAFLDRYYESPLRDGIERYILTGPPILRAGLRYFGGKPVPRADRLKSLASAALFAPRIGLRAIASEIVRTARRSPR
ncbi:MAG: NAD(P)/FAD-dependent oxidoreductase [Polyangiaceae bacterium]|nr:NAD(P)/FAD-dependent oxidoreductase [Polyangiaceae bacterium]